MKHLKLYLTAMLFAALGLQSCDEDFDTPPLTGPEATIEANTSILDLKKAFWFDDTNGVDTVGAKENGDHYIIKGRVVSSDEAGNVYKNLVIQDETAAITMSINANSLYNSYRLGQEVVIDVTDMYIGKYAGLQQFGFPDYSEQYGWQTTFMPLEFFQQHAQLNGLPDPSKIEVKTLTISELPTTTEGIIEMQSQLVRFDNVSFEEGGQATFAEYHTTVSHNITDGTASLIVRTSGYANFYNKTLPEGTGSIMGILGYFNGAWQLTLRDANDCLFGDDVEGAKNNPYTVSQAIEGQGSKSGWVEGVIVGAVAPGVQSVSSNSDIEWAAPFSLPNTLVIAESADVKDYTKCLLIELPQNSDLRTIANLADNEDNLGETIKLKGKFAQVAGMAGITENTGSRSEFVFNGSITVSNLDESFDSYGAQISALVDAGWTYTKVSGDKDWYLRNFDDNTYATMTGFNGKQAPFDSWLITPAINIDKAAEKIMSFRTQVADYGSTTSVLEVYVLNSNDPSAASLKKQLNANMAKPSATGAVYGDWANSGNLDLSEFTGKIYIGFRYYATSDANYATWCVDDVKVGTRGADAPVITDNDGSEAKPYTVADIVGGNTGTEVWVKGYIVGFSSGLDAKASAKFTAEGANLTNVLLAESKDEKNVENCIAVALPSGTVRDALNLREHPENLGVQVAVKGDIGTVYSITGVQNTSDYKF